MEGDAVMVSIFACVSQHAAADSSADHCDAVVAAILAAAVDASQID